MKQSMLALAFLIFVGSGFSQDTLPASRTKADYLKRSKTQKIAGWALMGAGAGLLALSVATYEMNIDLSGLYGSTQRPAVDNSRSTAFAIGGSCAAIAGVILFSSAKNNKTKAAALAFGNQWFRWPQAAGLAYKTQPALCLRVAF